MNNTTSLTDFATTFLTWELFDQPSLGRFSMEGELTLTSAQGTLLDTVWLLAPVMACHVYGQSPLVMNPAYEFMAAFSTTHVRLWRNYAPQPTDCPDTLEPIAQRFKQVTLHHSVIDSPSSLGTITNIIEATQTGWPITAQLTWILPSQHILQLSFPVKHINVHTQQKLFQVETGPLPFPWDVTKVPSSLIDTITPAYIAFNTLTHIDVAFRQGLTNIAVRHYTGSQSIPTHIQLFTPKQTSPPLRHTSVYH